MSLGIKKSGMLICCIVLLSTLCLTGCQNSKDNDEASELLVESMSLLESSGAYSYESEDITQLPDFSTQDTSKGKMIAEPFAMYSDSSSVMRDGSKMRIQLYQRENTDGSIDIFTRSNQNGGSVLGNWNLNHLPIEISKSILQSAKDSMKGNIELLLENKTLFKEDGNEQVEGKNTIILKGAITPDSAAQIYNEYLRDYYRKVGMVEDKDLTTEEAKNEIRSSEIIELQGDIPALAFSTNNIPVTIWIEEETHVPVKLEIDKTEVMQVLRNNEQIKKSVTTYKLLEMGSSVQIPIPVGIASEN